MNQPEFHEQQPPDERAAAAVRVFMATERDGPGADSTGIVPSDKSAVDAVPEHYETAAVSDTSEGTVARDTATDLTTRRTAFSNMLNEPAGPARSVVRYENERVDTVLDEPVPNPHSPLMAAGRLVLEKANLLKPEQVAIGQQEAHQQNVEAQTDTVREVLDQSREAIRNGVMKGLDDVGVDEYIGLRQDTSLLPPLFRDLHRQAELEAGHEMSFLTWMADYASDAQLTNVWQWHDNYLDKLDTAPEFLGRIGRVKADYTDGTLAAISARQLHPRMDIMPMGTLEDVTVVHGSPLSPTMAGSHAIVDTSTDKVSIRPDVKDTTLFHEFTHLNGKFIDAFTEGATELITATIYDHARPGDDSYDLEGSVYTNNIAMMRMIGNLTEGRINTYELSRYLTLSQDPRVNTIALAMAIDEHGFDDIPLTLPLITATGATAKKQAGKSTPTQLLLAQHAVLGNDFALAKDLFTDKEGNRIHHTVSSLFKRLASDEIVTTHNPDDVKIMAVTVVQAALIKQQTDGD